MTSGQIFFLSLIVVSTIYVYVKSIKNSNDRVTAAIYVKIIGFAVALITLILLYCYYEGYDLISVVLLKEGLPTLRLGISFSYMVLLLCILSMLRDGIIEIRRHLDL